MRAWGDLKIEANHNGSEKTKVKKIELSNKREEPVLENGLTISETL